MGNYESWMQEVADRLGLQHPVTVTFKESIYPTALGLYHGLIDGTHQIELAPQVDRFHRVRVLCHELVHAQQRETFGKEKYDALSAEGRAQYGNEVEGPLEVDAWRTAAELALTVLGPGHKIILMPVVTRSLQA